MFCNFNDQVFQLQHNRKKGNLFTIRLMSFVSNWNNCQIIVIISPMLRVYDGVLFTFSPGRHCMLQYSKKAEPHSVFTRQYILIFTLRIWTLSSDWLRLGQAGEVWGLIGPFCQLGRIFQPRRLSIQTLMEIKSMKIILFSSVSWLIYI